MVFLFLAALAVRASSTRAADEATIARDGKSDYSITVRADAAPALKLAAEDIAKYVEQMSGVKLPVRTRAGGEIERGKPIIAIAMSPHSSHAVVRVDDGTILIAGESPDGVLNAAYRFLDQLGCRFLAPQFNHYHGAAEIIPKKKTLTLKLDAPIEAEPKLKYRKLYVEEGHSHDIENLKQLAEWMPKVGYNMLVVPTDYQGSGRVRWDNWRKELTPELQKRGITIEVGGHGYQNFLNAEMEGGKLFEQHPDWFGKNAAGKPQRAKGWVFCTSNDSAKEYLTKNFLAYVKERPEIQVFDFWPPDGAKWCECDACEKLGSPSNRQAILVNDVRQKVSSVRPDLRLEVLAYHTSITPPESGTLDKEILVDFCPISQQFDVQIDDPSAPRNAEYVRGLKAWREKFQGDISIYTYYRKYAWDSLPVVIPRYMQKDLKWYATVPTQGVSVYSEPGDWFTYELNHYVLPALAWDQDADVERLIEKFCDARYGDEAGAAKSALDALENVVRIYCSVPHVPLKDADAIAKAQSEARELVDSVSAAAGRAADKDVKRSLQRLELMCTYAHRDLEIQHLRASKAPREQVVEKAKALHAWVKGHADDGVFLIKNQRLNLNRMLSRYGVGEPRKTAPATAVPE